MLNLRYRYKAIFMKDVFVLLILFIFLGYKNPESTKIISLQEAVDQELIELDIKGNIDSPHYYKPIELKVKSVSDFSFILNVKNGQRFLTQDSSVQDMIVVKSELIALEPGSEKSLDLNAMCTQRQNRGPAQNERYVLGPMAEKHLLQVSQKVQALETYNTIGQYAIWTISNNIGLDEIAGFNEVEAEALQKFVSEITGRKIPEKDTTDYLTNYNRPSLAVRTLGGKFEYGLVKTSAVTIGLFNEQNIIARELLNKPVAPRGDHVLNFEFDMAAYTEPVYFVRLIIDGEIKISYRIEV